MSAIREQIREAALSLGFARAGFAPVAPLPRRRFLEAWIRRGFSGQMSWMDRTAEVRHLPTHMLPGARTALVTLSSYEADAGAPRPPAGPPGPRGAVARYARGPDYHQVLWRRLERLARRVELMAGGSVETRLSVDTGPLMERELALAAGLGFLGKNTMLIAPRLGSYTFIGTVLMDLELPGDAPHIGSCGQCDLCLQACPAGALVEPYLLDARRCISYLTIEHRGVIPDDLKACVGSRVFGCDACQRVCPHNARAGRRGAVDAELSVPDAPASLALADLLGLRSGAYRRLVRGRALGRATRPMLQRNAAIAAGGLDTPDGAVVAALTPLAGSGRDEVRDAATWALRRLTSAEPAE